MFFFILERKLQRIKYKNENKVTGKNLIASMSEYKDIYLRDAFKNNLDLNTDANFNNNVVDVSYLQVVFRERERESLLLLFFVLA
jgi:hypothetical protein